MMTYRYFDFGAHADGRNALAAFVTLALDASDAELLPAVAVGLDGVAKLEAPVMAALIASLRRLREAGGSLALVTRRDEIRGSLRATGLDRVFTVVTGMGELESGASEPPAKAHHGHGLRRFGGFVAALVIVLSPAGVRAQSTVAANTEPPEAAAIVRKLVERNPSLASFQAHVDVKMRMTSFPWYAPTLTGTTYFKRPNNYEVVFRSVPFWAKGFDKLYTDAGDPGSWTNRYAIEVTGEETIDGRQDIELRMVQRVRGQIDHETIDVDPLNWVVDRVRYDYYNGGSIVLDQHFREENGYNLITDQQVAIHLPAVHAVGTAKYTDYRTNVAVDDSVFTKK
jgi:anti-anti-sigma regulatory factor